MAFEDLFGNNFTTSAGNMTPDPSDVVGGDPNKKSAWEQLFSDQNFIRGLGEAGAAVSSGQPIGKSVGDFASNLTRRRAVQKGAMATKEEQKTFQERLLELLGKGDLLSGKDQNDAFDDMKIDGDGNVTLSMKNTPQKQGFARNQPLETQRRPGSGGNDLPNFSNESGGEAFDFAGLDPEDIGMLLKAEQQFGQLDQNQAKMLLDEKARRQEAIARSQQNKSRLAELAANRAESKRQFDTTQTNRLDDKQKDRDFRLIELDAMNKNQMEEIAERDRLAKIPSAMQSTEQAMRMKELQSSTDLRAKQMEKMDAEMKVLDAKAKAGPGGMTAKQQADVDRDKAKLAMAETKFEQSTWDKIFDEEKPYEFSKLVAEKENDNPKSTIYYRTLDPENKFDFGTTLRDTDAEIIPIKLPKHVKTGRQFTMKDVMEVANDNKITPEEVLIRWGLIK